MTDENTTEQVDSNLFGGPTPIERIELDTPVEAVVSETKIIRDLPRKIQGEPDDNGEMKYSERYRLIVGFDFAPGLKDKNGRELAKMHERARATAIGFAAYGGIDKDGNPLEGSKPHAYVKTGKDAGMGGKLLTLAQDFFGKDKCPTIADVERLIKGKKVRVATELVNNPKTNERQPKLAIKAILG